MLWGGLKIWLEYKTLYVFSGQFKLSTIEIHMVNLGDSQLAEKTRRFVVLCFRRKPKTPFEVDRIRDLCNRLPVENFVPLLSLVERLFAPRCLRAVKGRKYWISMNAFIRRRVFLS